MSNLQSRLLSDFEDADIAHAYMDAHVNYKLAAQIFQTRQARGWTQEDLSDRSGVAQARISKIEAGDFDSLTMATLRKFAQAFDVTVRMELQPFSYGVFDVCNLSAATLVIPERVSSLGQLRNGLTVSGWFHPEPTIIPSPTARSGSVMTTQTVGARVDMPGPLSPAQSATGNVLT